MSKQSTISAIAARKHDPYRAAVQVDGKTVAVLSASAIEQLGLHVGKPWDNALRRRATEAAAFDSAYHQAIQRLNIAARSCSEMETTLRRNGHNQLVIGDVLNRLISLRAIDDEALGRALIQETLARKAAGSLLLHAKLLRRGLCSELVERLVGEACCHLDSVAAASALAHRQRRFMSKLDTRTQKQRLWGLLVRRGFDTETIEAALVDVAVEDTG